MKHLYSILLSCFMINSLYAKYDILHNKFEYNPASAKIDSTRKKAPEKNWKEKISFGGNVSLNLGNNSFVLLNPQIIYKISDQLWLATGPFYQYQRVSFVNGGSFSSSVYGATALARRVVTRNFFAQVEYNLFNFESGNSARRINGNYGLAGGGVNIGQNFALTISYVLFASPNNLFPFGNSPWVIRGGFFF